ADNYSEWDEFYEFSASNTRPPDDWLSSELADWLPLRSDIRTLLWLGADGNTIWSMGSAHDVARLADLAAATHGEPLATRLRFEDGPALAVAVPITGFPLKRIAGTFAVAEPIGTAMAQEFAALSNATTVTIRTVDEAATPVTNTVRAPAFTGMTSSLDEGVLHVTANLIGLGGERVASVSIFDSGVASADPLYVPLLTALGTSGLALAAALLLALTTTRFVRKPIDELAAYVRDVGMRAVEGAPYAPLEVGGDVPAEFRTMLGTVDDLTGRLAARQAELRGALAQAEEAEERFRIAVDDSPEAKLLFVDGMIRVANPAAGFQMGVPAERLIGLSMADAMGGRALPVAESDQALTLAELVAHAVESGPVTVVVDAAGRGTRWLQIAASVHPGSGEVLVTSRDVTEDRRRDELRAEILETVSHDLKSPLSVISGYLDILERQPDTEVVGKAVGGARDGMARVLEMLEDLLATTKAEDFLAPRTMSLVHLDRLAADTVDSLRPVVRQEIELRTCCAATTRGEDRRLRQALANLIGNAAKYSPDDSTITVALECLGDRAALVVEDEGPGVPPEERDRIFERFERADATSSQPGLGLGLYIVRTIVQGHGGSVHVEQRAEGTGARFVVELPLAAGRPPAG
ncbi:MAG: hypothetical protein FDZ70_08760, partial [Actinobacteria bacterium]